jgi:hypothetical protein
MKQVLCLEHEDLVRLRDGEVLSLTPTLSLSLIARRPPRRSRATGNHATAGTPTGSNALALQELNRRRKKAIYNREYRLRRERREATKGLKS